MRKILTLFICIIMTASMSLGVLPFAANAANGGAELASVKLDISGSDITATSNNIAGGKISVFGNEYTNNVYNLRADSTIMGENVIIINRRPSANGNVADNSDTRLQIPSYNLSSGKVSFTFGLYCAATSDGNLAFRYRKGSTYAPAQEIKDLNLDPYKWYDIEAFIDLDATTNNCYLAAYNKDGSLHRKVVFGCDFSGSYLGLMFLWGSPKTDVLPAGAPAGLTESKAFYALKDFYIVHHTGETTARILSVGSAGEVAHSQNQLSFMLSKDIPGLAPSHVSVVNPGGQIVGAETINVTSDGANYMVNVTLESNLAPWTDYILKIDGACYDGYKQVTSDGIVNVQPITMDFHTIAAPFDMKEPDFTYHGSYLKAETMIINTSGSPKDVCLVFASYSDDGRIKSITSEELSSFEAAYPGSDAQITAGVTDGDVLRLFVINGWQDKNPLFGKSWTVNYDGSTASAPITRSGSNMVPGTVKLGEFDYSDIKIGLDLNCGTSAATEGILCVYKEGQNISAQNPPVFADYIIVASDGTYSKDILFDSQFDYGTYVVEFCSSDLVQPITNTFSYYSPAQLLENKRQNILNCAKQSSTSGVLMQVILGINENEVKVNDNFDVFITDVGTSSYNSVQNKDEVFALMISSVSNVSGYNDLILLFKQCSERQYNSENQGGSSPSSNNKNYGSSSTLITESITKEDVSKEDISSSVFSDMKGHWAENFVSELVQMGIINGYDDGSFRGENYITRAELAKILMQAFGEVGEAHQIFGDVMADSWYGPYVTAASQLGVVTGYEDGTFAPEIFVTRQDAVLMLYRALSLKKELPTGYTLFTDDLDISSYAHHATRCLGELGIVTGDGGGAFRPLNSITRAEVSAIVCRGFDYIESH